MKYITLLLLNFVFICSNVCQVWTPVSPYPSGYSYFDIHMEESGEGIAVGFNGIISRTLDFGETFTNIYTGITSQYNSIHKSENGTYVIVGYDGTIMRSVNDGLEWEKIPYAETTSLNTVYFLDDKIGIILGENGTLLRTADDGKTWRKINIESENNLNKLTFINSTTGFIWSDGERTIYKTTDAGLTWDEINFEYTIRAIHFKNENEGTIYYGSSLTKGNSLVTTNGGLTWDDSEDNLPSFRTVKFIDNQIGFATNAIGRIYVTSDGGTNWDQKEGTYGLNAKMKIVHANLIYLVGLEIYRSTNLAETFESLRKGVQDQYLEEIAFGPNNEVYIAGRNGIYKSSNGGKNFNRLPIDSIQSMVDIKCINANNVVALGFYSTFVKSSDGGETWHKKILPEKGTYVSMSNIENTLWVLTQAGSLMKSEDLGETWETIHLFESDMFYHPGYITFISNDVGFMRASSGKVMRTENGGVDWEIIDVEWIGTKSISFIDNKIGYMSGIGVYKTVDGGANWELINEGLHQGFSLFFRNENIGYYTELFGRIFKTEDGGISWSQEISNTNSYLFSIKFNSSGIGIAVGDRGAIIRIEEEPLSVSVFYHPMVTLNMTVFPNPTTQEINLISENINDKSVLLLYNINGHLISEMKGNQSGSPIDVRSLSPGTYYLIHSNGEMREKGVFVKQ